MDNKENQINIELSPEVAKGSYSNLAIITHSPNEFIVDFATVLPGLNKPTVNNRIIMNPLNAKRLLMALNDNINKFEASFGPINSGVEPKGTLNLADFPHFGNGSKS